MGVRIQNAIFLGSAKPGSGAGFGGNFIEKFASMPTASIANCGRIGLYAGTTDSTYIHGYIYECKDDVSYEANFVFPKNTFASEDFYKAGKLITDSGVIDPTQAASGSMTYALAGNLWSIVFKDSNGNALNTAYNIYTDDLEQDYDIIPVIDPSEFVDEQVVDFTINNIIKHLDNARWERINVQPATQQGD